MVNTLNLYNTNSEIHSKHLSKNIKPYTNKPIGKKPAKGHIHMYYSPAELMMPGLSKKLS